MEIIIIAIIIVWLIALYSQWSHIKKLFRLFFKVLSTDDSKGEKKLMIFCIVPMMLFFIIYYIFLRPIPAAIIAAIGKCRLTKS